MSGAQANRDQRRLHGAEGTPRLGRHGSGHLRQGDQRMDDQRHQEVHIRSARHKIIEKFSKSLTKRTPRSSRRFYFAQPPFNFGSRKGAKEFTQGMQRKDRISPLRALRYFAPSREIGLLWTSHVR